MTNIYINITLIWVTYNDNSIRYVKYNLIVWHIIVIYYVKIYIYFIYVTINIYTIFGNYLVTINMMMITSIIILAYDTYTLYICLS